MLAVFCDYKTQELVIELFVYICTDAHRGRDENESERERERGIVRQRLFDFDVSIF